jgi:predicted nucleotidyltransferase
MSKEDKIIHTELQAIESEFGVTIFYACESGSRAWGFESTDSDYDVRFLYYHDLDWYLSVDDRRDVIGKPITGTLDINGWDIRKALKLLRKSNPPLLEWLQSPIVYKEIGQILQILKKTLPKFYSPRNCNYHYLHMAQGNFRDYLSGNTVWMEKYFYVLRPILACRWIERFDEPVPMEFQKLVKRTVDDDKLTIEIANLIARKKSGEELDFAPRIPGISNFIESELDRLVGNKPEKIEYKNYDELNEIFRIIVKTNGNSAPNSLPA